MADSNRNGLSFLPQFGALGIVAVVVTAILGSRPSSTPSKGLAEAPIEQPATPAAEAKPAPANFHTHLSKVFEFQLFDNPPDFVTAKLPPFKPDVQVLVMTVPDPVVTQFGARYDQMIDALCRAMADVNVSDDSKAGTYTLERHWFPWQPDGKKTDLKANAAATEKYPGVVVFRGSNRPKSKWLVLLIAESPTSGVHAEALNAALDLAALDPKAKTHGVRIVGPNFTGSQALMLPVLEAWQSPKANWLAVNLISGSAHGIQSTEKLRERMGRPASDVGRPAITFRLTHASTEVLNRAILYYLAKTADADSERPLSPDRPNQQGGPLPVPAAKEVAFLIESNSGYGNLAAGTVTGDDTWQPWMLRFPMYLSRLSGIQTQAQREREEQLGLSGSSMFKRLDEKRASEDLLPSADEARTALINQRLLQDYWETLRRERVRYVGILASDQRDRIFLIGQLRKEVPNAAIFVHGFDLQVAHPEYLPQTRGVLAVSSYPLYPISQEWAKREIDRRDARRVPFASSHAQGTYNAVLVQCGASDKLLDYRGPGTTDPAGFSPPVWISTVGEDGTLLPLAYFTNYPRGVTYEILDTDEDKKKQFAVEAMPPQTPPLRHLMLVLVGAAVWGGIAVRKAFGKSPGGADTLIVRRLKYQYATLVGIGLVLGCLPLAIYFYYLALQPPAGKSLLMSGTDAFLLVAAVGVGVFAGGLGLLSLPSQILEALGYRCPFGRGKVRASTDPDDFRPGVWAQRVPLFLHLFGAVLSAVILVVLVCFALDSEAGTRLLFLERAANVGAGCSPIVTAGFLALGLFLYGVLALRLLRLQTDYRVACPYPTIDTDETNTDKPYHDVLNGIDRQAHRLNGIVIGLWTLMRRGGRTFVVAMAVAVFVLALPPLVRAHWTWEGWAWDLACLVGVVALFVLAVVSAFRLYAVWKEVEKLLRLIGRVPMMGAFDRLSAETCRVFSKYLLAGRRRAEDLLVLHSILVRMDREGRAATAAWSVPGSYLPDKIRDRIKTVQVVYQQASDSPETEAGAATASATDSTTTKAASFPADHPDEAPVPRELSGAQASQFSEISAGLVKELLPGWIGRPLPEAYGSSIGTAAKDGKAEMEGPAGWKGLAEQFIALQVVVFLAQYFQQVRLMAYLAALPAGALLMAVTSYPFMPERLILYSVVGLVAAVLGVVLWVLYRTNKNPIVSRVTRTTPGRLSLDAGLIQNLTAFVLPLLLLAVVQVGGRWRTVAEPILDLIR